MQWYDILFELIDFRSFSSLWYWLALSVVWSSASHWVLGVPYDLIRRARKDADAQRDLEDMLRVNVHRMLFYVRGSGVLSVAGTAFVLSALVVLAVTGIEFAQALLCILLPMLPVFALRIRLALQFERGEHGSADLDSVLSRHRATVQVIGMLAIFFTGMFGMFQNVRIGAL
ncbi:MAG: component of SufBCD complex [Rhodobacteraceae bacterium PARR1]|nr:MAG: component of SufBCD complex [Rhodobacteraceae bacterium PARR1]